MIKQPGDNRNFMHPADAYRNVLALMPSGALEVTAITPKSLSIDRPAGGDVSGGKRPTALMCRDEIVKGTYPRLRTNQLSAIPLNDHNQS